MNKALKIDPELTVKNARRIVDARNWVIHGYDRVDDLIIWGTVINHFPKLQKEIQDYLED